MQTLKRQGVDEPCIKVLENIYRDTACRPLSSTGKAKKLATKKDVRQGDTKIPKLFKGCFQESLEKSEWDKIGLKTHSEYIDNSRLVDDNLTHA